MTDGREGATQPPPKDVDCKSLNIDREHHKIAKIIGIRRNLNLKQLIHQLIEQAAKADGISSIIVDSYIEPGAISATEQSSSANPSAVNASKIAEGFAKERILPPEPEPSFDQV